MSAPRPRLLLLPGLEGSGELFDGLVAALAGRFETQVARYPTSCTTYADVGPYVRQLIPGSRPSMIVAESFSTPLSIEIAAAFRHEIAALVLCNGFCANPLSGFESMIASLSGPWLFHFPLTSVALRTFLVGADASDELVEAVQRAVAPVSPAVLYARLKAVLQCDAREALARLSIPVLYLHATRDRLIGQAGVKKILRIKPDVLVEHVEGPHLLIQRHPKRCGHVIARFLEQISGVPKPD